MSIGIQGTTTQNSTQLEVDLLHKAARVSIRPIDLTGGGAYAISTTNGATGVAAGAGAAAEVYALRNSSSTKTVLVHRVTMDMWTGATGFTAGVSQFVMKAARAFTVGPTAGTTTTLTGNNCKLATAYQTTSSVVFICDDSVLTSGTEVADDTALGMVIATTTNAAQTVHVSNGVLFDAEIARSPLKLLENEGFIIYATVPATGVWFLRVTSIVSEVLNATVAG